MLYICRYIYIERERERARQSAEAGRCLRDADVHHPGDGASARTSPHDTSALDPISES